jgi:nucleotide-binding universal stress UspA family protein
MKILLATDGSASAEIALELVHSIDWPKGSAIRIISVIETAETALSGAWTPALAQDVEHQAEDLLASASASTEHAANYLSRDGLIVEYEVFEGRPGSCIVEDATRFGADLIVVGSRGHGPIGSMLLGSVSAEVADHAPCPVLVARSPRLTRLVFGADGSEYARTAEEWLERWPIFSNTAIEVTSVAEFAESDRLQISDHQHVAESAADHMRAAGLRAAPHVAEGDAAHELIRVAADDAADAIVIGTHGRTGLKRLIMGSVARNVMLHARCSVLIVRQAQHKAAA